MARKSTVLATTTILSPSPLVIATETVSGLSYYKRTEERLFESDEQYDANMLDRLQAMVNGARASLVQLGSIQVHKLPPFNPKNKLRVTVEVLPPGDDVPVAEDAEPDGEK